MELFIPIMFFGGLALIPMFIAWGKGRDPLSWWAYGFFLFPIAFIHALLLSDNAYTAELKAIASGNLKCPHCAE